MAKVSSSNGLEKCPKLRFPGFIKQYKAVTLNQISSQIKRNDPQSNAPIMMLSARNGFIKQSDKYSRDNAGQSLKKYTLLKKGELAYNHGASKAKQFGCCYELHEEEARIPYVYHCFKVRDTEYSPYIALALNNPKMDRQLKRLVSSSVRMDGLLNISYDEYMSVTLYLPDFPEQKHIANFIENLERRIEKQKTFIETLKKYKRGLLHKILTEKIKVTQTAWNMHKIGDFLSPKNIKQLPTSDIPLMAFTATGGVCDKGERYDRSFLIKDTSAKLYKRTDFNDFIYSSNNLDVGSIGLNLYGSAVISDVYEIFSISGADPWFISETIQHKSVLHKILKYRQGVLYGQYRIYAEDFLMVPIKVPSFEIQKQIGDIFSKIEYRILKEQNLLENLEKTKYYFLQQLFI
ncbi:restriction endonuclease subunit S [uncultured Succinatimonas sp.]|uniref:restriction endonuclease subunit S n=1 Tax=uncultured Succinatimonas sp. TaxID=1262973 RepID=UPI0025F56BC7|nr:restriction endonuclease subunit S [uncultured Succinatimonas sp.]